MSELPSPEPLASDGSESSDGFAIAILSLVTETRKRLLQEVGISPETECIVDVPPKEGGSNIVYRAAFSDGTNWAVRIPINTHGDNFPAAWRRKMKLDVSTQQFIYSKIPSMPVPQIYGWSSGTDNIIGRPYAIMDYLQGKNLVNLWNDRSWISDTKRERIFTQLAGWVTELAAIEFPRIGRFDPDARDRVAAFEPDPDRGFEEECGPYESSSAFLSDLLRIQRQKEDSPTLALLQLFLSALPDPTLDGPPFALHHPDFDSQNILVADDGTITGVIDWDHVYIGSQQGGAAQYPAWITVDWDPLFYGWNPQNTEEENAKFDTPEELHRYREMYLAAVDKASHGKLTCCTRNSHVWTSLEIAVTNRYAATSIVYHLSKYVFGTGLFEFDAERAIESGAWYKNGYAQTQIAQVIDESDSERESNPSDDSGSDTASAGSS